MNKKILAGALASVMAVACAANVSALQTELDCPGWWTAHTDGVEITADGVEITFDSKTYETAPDNWDGPLYVVYTSPDASIKEAGQDGYTEYFVGRGDMWGWIGGSNPDSGFPEGYSWERTQEPDWDNWLADLKAGVSGSLKATRDGNKVTVVFEVNKSIHTAVIPVDADKVYVSLGGQDNTYSNIKLVDNTPAPTEPDEPKEPTEPAPGEGENPPAPGNTNTSTDPNKDKPAVDTGVEGVAIVAGLAIVAAGAVVVAKKRK